jgi:tetrahydromethanopterin S-methyltransferase subunit G
VSGYPDRRTEDRVHSHRSWLAAVVIAAAALCVSAETVADDAKEARDVATLQEVLKATKPGAKVRVIQTDGTVFEGGLVAADRLTLFNSLEARQYAVELEKVDTLWELEISKARGQRIGGTVGLVLGALTGFYLGLAVSSLCSEGNCDDTPDVGLTVSGAFLGGLVGGCAGLLIGNGASTGTPEWVRRYPVSD